MAALLCFPVQLCLSYSPLLTPPLLARCALQIAYHEKEAWNVYELFHSRFNLHKRAYKHRVAGAVEAMYGEVLDSPLARVEYTLHGSPSSCSRYSSLRTLTSPSRASMVSRCCCAPSPCSMPPLFCSPQQSQRCSLSAERCIARTYSASGRCFPRQVRLRDAVHDMQAYAALTDHILKRIEYSTEKARAARAPHACGVRFGCPCVCMHPHRLLLRHAACCATFILDSYTSSSVRNCYLPTEAEAELRKTLSTVYSAFSWRLRPWLLLRSTQSEEERFCWRTWPSAPCRSTTAWVPQIRWTTLVSSDARPSTVCRAFLDSKSAQTTCLAWSHNTSEKSTYASFAARTTAPRSRLRCTRSTLGPSRWHLPLHRIR